MRTSGGTGGAVGEEDAGGGGEAEALLLWLWRRVCVGAPSLSVGSVYRADRDG
jgi:hypothetical protein